MSSGQVGAAQISSSARAARSWRELRSVIDFSLDARQSAVVGSAACATWQANSSAAHASAPGTTGRSIRSRIVASLEALGFEVLFTLGVEEEVGIAVRLV